MVVVFLSAEAPLPDVPVTVTIAVVVTGFLVLFELEDPPPQPARKLTEASRKMHVLAENPRRHDRED
jgi:hypothetical protein